MAEPEKDDSQETPKKIVIWSADAKTELRAIDRETAIRVLRAIDRYLTTGAASNCNRRASSSGSEWATTASSSFASIPPASKSFMSAIGRKLTAEKGSNSNPSG